MRPEVTFFVPCYRYGRFVANAIDSLLEQSFRAIEIIAIDDASPDDTGEVLRRYAGDDRVRVISHSRNIGHIPSYNEAIGLARGRYVGLLNADDYCIARDAVEKQVALFESAERVAMVYSAYRMFWPDGTSQDVSPWPATGVHSGIDEFRALIWGNYVLHSGTLVRADVQAAVGPYKEYLPHTGDWDLWLRIAARNDVGYIADPLFAYRMHGYNMRYHAQTPTGEARESLVALNGALSDLPAEAHPDIAAVRKAALDHAVLQNPWFDLASGLSVRTLLGIIAGVQLRPGLLRRGEVWRLAVRLGALTALGTRRYRQVDHMLSQRRSRRVEPLV